MSTLRRCLAKFLFSMSKSRVACMKSSVLVLIAIVAVQLTWWMWYSSGREREDIRPVMSWYDGQMELLANEKRSIEEEEIFQRLTFDYQPRVSPPDDQEIEQHRHQYSMPNCDSDQWHREGVHAGRCPYRTETRFPVLVWWSPLTYHKQLIRRCTYGRCVFTQNRRETQSSRTRAILFSGSHLDPRDMPLPRQEYPEWMVFHDTAPHLAPLLYSPLAIGLFNVTATFSRFSNYPLTLQHLHDISSLTSKAWMVKLEEKRAALQNGGALVVYAVDDCDVPSDRDNLVRLLMDLIPVDLLGRCPVLEPNHKGEKRRKVLSGWDEMREFAAHKFALVFESDMCSDYIGAGLWKALSCGTVPVYVGDGERLQSLLPHPKAVILVSDFPSLPDLIKYLNKLDSNDALYRQHLQHAINGTINKNLQELFASRNYGDETSPLQDTLDGFECFACDNVYKQLLATAYSKQITKQQANASHFSCHEPQPYSRSSAYSWQEKWQQGRKTGEALFRMLQSSETNSSNFARYLSKRPADT